ncbi:hypothetical protein QL285_052737 [Trifolium repens]|nr:hypothetical protein QL285_052737 [Trifolium repens]
MCCHEAARGTTYSCARRRLQKSNAFIFYMKVMALDLNFHLRKSRLIPSYETLDMVKIPDIRHDANCADYAVLQSARGVGSSGEKPSVFFKLLHIIGMKYLICELCIQIFNFLQIVLEPNIIDSI